MNVYQRRSRLQIEVDPAKVQSAAVSLLMCLRVTAKTRDEAIAEVRTATGYCFETVSAAFNHAVEAGYLVESVDTLWRTSE